LFLLLMGRIFLFMAGMDAFNVRQR
jgi:hypothetical protein